MQLINGKQISIQDLDNCDIDLLILAENHEKRVHSCLNKVKSNNQIKKTIAFLYKETKKKKSKDVLRILIKSHNDVAQVLDDHLASIDSETINIVVDYSCMTKSWYYTIIMYLHNKNLSQTNVNVYFCYTPSKYSKPLEPKPNTEIAPLPGKYIVPTDKPKALIVCLGYEQSKAEGIINHLDPQKYFLFYSKPALENEFVNKIEQNNAELLKNGNITTFKLNDLLNLERELTALYYSLRDKYSIIIAPLGPKPFTFISMLMTIKYSDIDIWRVGSGSDINEYNREPIDDDSYIISKVLFQNEICSIM